MQKMNAMHREEFPEKRHQTHKRLERWIRLQQFVYGLPDDYSYAVCTTEREGKFESRALVSVGWMTWFGHGMGPDRQHSLSVALLEASEAFSANGTKVFFHGVGRLVMDWLEAIRMVQGKANEAVGGEEVEQSDRLAS
jgi:hypothetical protein